MSDIPEYKPQPQLDPEDVTAIKKASVDRAFDNGMRIVTFGSIFAKLFRELEQAGLLSETDDAANVPVMAVAMAEVVRLQALNEDGKEPAALDEIARLKVLEVAAAFSKEETVFAYEPTVVVKLGAEFMQFGDNDAAGVAQVEALVAKARAKAAGVDAGKALN